MNRSLLLCLFVLTTASACGTAADDGPPRSSGYVEATDIRVASKVAGRVLTVAVTEGERVTAGQVLVTLATTDADLQIGRLTAERAQADAQLRLLLAGSRAEDIDQAVAQARAADADLELAQAELEAAQIEFARFSRLVEQRAGATKPRDDAEARRRAAAARVRAMTERVTAASASVARLKTGARREEIEAARARLSSVDASLATVRADIAEATITATNAGIVASRLVEPGELVAPRTPLLVLMDLDRAWASAYVEEPMIGGLKLNQTATVVTDGGHRVPGRITFIAPRAEFTPRNVQTADERARLVYRVTVSVDNRDGVLKPGMPVEVVWDKP
jgi:HlyD family secretion protein